MSTVFAISADPTFGVLVSFGIGGVATELFDDHAYRAVPLTDVDAAELISAPRAEPLPNGYLGAGVVARGPLIDLTSRPSTLADDLPEVSDLQLRPVLADAPCQENGAGPSCWHRAGTPARKVAPTAPQGGRRNEHRLGPLRERFDVRTAQLRTVWIPAGSDLRPLRRLIVPLKLDEPVRRTTA